MKRNGKLPELLSPAGDFECLVAAVLGGADAIYVGARQFSARAYAKNFDLDEIARAVRYCHLHGVRLYVTVNTLLSTSEISDAVNLAGELRNRGVDALISADLGFIREVRAAYPDLEIHASTQVSVHNSCGADEMFGMGCTRVVLARELSADNIAKTVENCKAECEIFLHGALCVSHSGQCLFSSLVGGRSGNRGECAQPCRLNYLGDKYPLSLKDLSLAGHIPELIDSGVASLKIEGRMKAPSYVYTVTKIYRRLLDEKRSATPGEMKELERVFSRSGFTDGYFTGKLKSGMTGTRQKSDIDATREASVRSYTPERLPVTAEGSFRLGERSRLTLHIPAVGERKAYSVTAYGQIPEKSLTSPLIKDEVIGRLCKMGNTYLSLDAKDVRIDMDEGINLPISMLNALRREAADLAEGYGIPEPCEIKRCNRPLDPSRSESLKTALFLLPDVLMGIDKRSLSYFDLIFVPLFSFRSHRSNANGVYIPPVVMENELPEVREELRYAMQNGAKYALVSNIGALSLARETNLIPIGDFRLNVMNSYSRAALADIGLSDVILSPELSEKATAGIGGRAIVYGRIPLMLTERCFIGENFGCSRCQDASITDRRGTAFPMIREWKHRNLILNSHPTYIADIIGKYRARASFSEHYLFSVESAADIERIVRSYEVGLPPDGVYRRMGRRDFN